MSASMTQTKTQQAVVAAERQPPSPSVKSEAAARAVKAVRAPDEMQDLPADWHVKPLSAFNASRPATINPASYKDETFEYYSIPAYQDGQLPTLTKGHEIGSSKLLLDSGTVLFGKLNPRVEKVWCVGNHTAHRKIGSTEWLPLVPSDDVDEQFLYFLMWSEHVMPNAKTLVSGSTPSRQRVDPRSFYRIAVPLPPLPEQRKIAAVLGVVQRAMEQQERLLALTAELKKALLHQLFTQGLRGESQKQTEIGPVPESWGVAPLEGVAKIERGKFTHRPRNEPRFYGGQTPFVQTGDVSSCDGRIREYSQTLNEEGVLISKVFPAGTILITIAANIGFSGILEFDSACPDSLIGLTPNERIDVEFLQYYLTTQQPVMDRLAPRGTQKNINIQFLKPWLVPLPSSDEQREIREVLNAVDSRIRVTRRKHGALTALFRTLLHQLMTAQIRV